MIFRGLFLERNKAIGQKAVSRGAHRSIVTLWRYIQLFLGCLSHVYGVLLGLFVCIVGLGALFGLAEGLDLADAIYFAFVTAFTIGFGDITPVTLAGRLIAITLAILGMVFLGVIVGISNRTIMRIMHPEE